MISIYLDYFEVKVETSQLKFEKKRTLKKKKM